MANASVYSLLNTSLSLVGLSQDLECLGSQERRLTEEIVCRRTQELAEFIEAARVGLKSIGPARMARQLSSSPNNSVINNQNQH